VGFTVSKKVGNSPERNRVRRRLREVVRLTPSSRLRPGHDYVLIGRRAALQLPFEQLFEDFTRALGRYFTADVWMALRACCSLARIRQPMKCWRSNCCH